MARHPKCNDVYDHLMRFMNNSVRARVTQPTIRYNIEDKIAEYWKPYATKSESFQFVQYDNGFYVGQLHNGKRHGHGAYIWNDWSMYVGDWENGEQCDDRGLSLQHDYYFCGNFENGKREGQGWAQEHYLEFECYYRNGQIVTESNFFDRRRGTALVSRRYYRG